MTKRSSKYLTPYQQRKRTQKTYVLLLYEDEQPTTVYGPFNTREEACERQESFRDGGAYQEFYSEVLRLLP